jgi:hypothetical protein
MSSSGLEALELCLGARARSVAPPSPPPLLPPSPPSPPPLHPPHALISHAVQVAMNQIDAVGVVYRAQLDELKNKKLNHTEMLSQGQEHHKKARAELDRLLSPFRPDEMLHRAKVASTSGSRPRSRSPAGKGKDNGKSMDKDKGMDKGNGSGNGIGKGMDKGKGLELLEPIPSTSRALILLQELRDKMDQVLNRGFDKTLPALELEVLDEVTPLLERVHMMLERIFAICRQHQLSLSFGDQA